MKNLVNNRNVNFVELEESGIYSEKLLQQIKEGRYQVLNSEEFAEQRKQEKFMKPLLYAERKEKRTYEIYSFLGRNLQEQIANSEPQLAIEIIKYKPELIKDTPIAENDNIMMEAAKIRPEVIEHMSSNLKHNKQFIKELCELDNKEITAYVEQECRTLKAIIENPNLASNFEFMRDAIREDATLIGHASEELKNNYEFIKEASGENKEVIDYVAEHTEEFGEDALKGAKESLTKHITNDIDAKFEEEKEKLQLKQGEERTKAEHRLARTKNGVDKIQARFEQMIEYAYSDGLKPEERIKAHEKIIRRTNTVLNVVEGLDKDIRSMLEQYKRISEAEVSKIIEKENLSITPKQIEKKTEDVRISEINDNTKAIREEIITEREGKIIQEKQTNENKEIGEQ